ncbi:MAG TPA: TonB-dependent receptor, partial [Bacteroidales bacterium]|nr:TonB-dependent receptor [Bacteroidales bacterium]
NEPLAGVSIVSMSDNTGTVSDSTGSFRLKVSSGRKTLRFSLLGYKVIEREVAATSNISIKISMVADVKQMEEVTVTAQNKQNQVKDISTGTFVMNRKEIDRLPVLLGETDYFKAIQLMPGIQSTGEGNAAIYVRGGAYDQNLVLLDNATVYNPTHLLGFYSVFNSDIIGSIKVIKSGIPAEYGNRLSSVMEFSTKSEVPSKVCVKGNLGLISTRIGVDVPLLNNKAFISFTARKTYLNTLLDGFRKAGWIRHRSVLYKSGYDFYDLNFTGTVLVNSRNRITLSAYKGDDIFKLKADAIELNTDLRWGNDIISLTWNKIFSQSAYMETSVYTSNYGLNMKLDQNQYGFNLKSSIHDYGFKNKITWLKSKHKITAGFSTTYHDIQPNTSNASSDSAELDFGSVNNYYSMESGIFAGDEFELSKKFSFYGGVRFNNFIHLGPYNQYIYESSGSVVDTLHYKSLATIKSYWGIDCRAAVRYLINDNLSVKAAFNTNQQFIHSVNASSITFPTDFWISSSNIVKPQRGIQWAVGVFQNIPQKNITASVELYYKTMNHQIEFYKSLFNAMDNSAFDENLIFGKGRAYGAELLIRKTKGIVTGWIGYTYSKTEKSFDDIENGRWFPAKYDRPHDLSVVANYTPGGRWSFSAVFVYGTGSTYTPVVGRYFVANNLVNEYGKYNSARLPDYHRCDVAATLQLKKTRFADSRLIFSIYNLYSRKNPFFVYPKTKGSLDHFELSITPKEVSIFPILPSIAWEFTF